MQSSRLETPHSKDARIRIQIEFIEMPHLALTLAQVHHQCDLPEDICEAALASLVAGGFLARTGDGSFLRRGLGRQADRRSGFGEEWSRSGGKCRLPAVSSLFAEH